MPKVSVIMPVYNGEKYLKEAIDSILCQTYSDFEFIIINDCSADGSENIVLSYNDDRIVYIKNEENSGVARSLNVGLEKACGEYIARMDADDIALPDRFEKQVNFLDTHSEYGVCGCNIEKFSENEERPFLFSTENDSIKIDLLFDSAVPHPGVMMRKSLGKDLYYDAHYEQAEDFELWTRLIKKTQICNLPEILLKYRVHDFQVSNYQNERQLNSSKKIRYNNLAFVLGEIKANEYIDVFDGFCNGSLASQKEYDKFCECLEKIEEKGDFNKKLLKKQFSLIKINLAKNNNFKFKIKTGTDAVMLAKFKLLQIKTRWSK